MKATASRKPKQGESWPRKVTVGRVTVTIYKRLTPSGCDGFLVANYSGDKRNLDSYATEADAIEAAQRLARQLSERNVIGAGMTKEQSLDYASAVQALKPFNVTLPAATAAVAECLKVVGDLANLHAAVGFYAARHKRVEKKPVGEAVQELLKVKEARAASPRYLQDLRYRLGVFAGAFHKDVSAITTAELGVWLDNQKFAPQSYENFRRVLNLFFTFAVSHGFAADNPVEGVERVKVRNGDVEVFTPQEIARLLAAASPEFLPCLAIGAFAGLRSAEVQRLEWSDVHLAERHIVVTAGNSKTASRRIVPIADNLAAWLLPYANRQGKVWAASDSAFSKAQVVTAKAAGVRWKSNAARHSFASYSFAIRPNAGEIAGFCGNSAGVIHKHYRQLVTPAAAQRWFDVKPETVRPEVPGNVPPALPANVVTLAATKG